MRRTKASDTKQIRTESRLWKWNRSRRTRKRYSALQQLPMTGDMFRQVSYGLRRRGRGALPSHG